MSRTKARSKTTERHPDQLDDLIVVKPLPVDILPSRGYGADHDARDADIAAQVTALRRVASELRDAQNAMVREWLGWHYVAGTAARVAALEPGVKGLPNELALAMYHAAKPLAPTAASDVLTAALNWVVTTIRSQTSPRTEWKRWQAVLLPRMAERPWHWSDRQPIRLSAKTASVTHSGQKLCVCARVVKGAPPIRLLLKGWSGTARPEIQPKFVRNNRCRPSAGPGGNGRQYNERLATFQRLLDARGAMLSESPHGGWRFTFLERRPAPALPVRDDLRTMFIRTSNEAGWRVRLNGRSVFLVVDDALADLADARRRQIARRAELKLKQVDSRSRESQAIKHLWENYCRTLNQRTVHEIVTWAARHNIERIAVMAGDEWCALGSVGNDDLEQGEPTRYPFAAFATILRQKAMREGIIVVSRPNRRSVKRRKELWQRKAAREQLQAVAK